MHKNPSLYLTAISGNRNETEKGREKNTLLKTKVIIPEKYKNNLIIFIIFRFKNNNRVL